MLFYIKGGGAWAHDHYIFTEIDTVGTDSSIQDATKTRTGWTAGVGWEWAFAPNWSAWVEWNHYDFGNKIQQFSPDQDGTVQFEWIKQRIDAFTVGVNYRFNFARY
jgi:outer membrane immunogenic protein